MGGAASHILQQTILPLVSIVVLGTALNVGSFNTVFAIAGALALLAVGSRRHPENRLFILGMSSIALMALNVMLGTSLTLAALIVAVAARQGPAGQCCRSEERVAAELLSREHGTGKRDDEVSREPWLVSAGSSQ